MLKEKNNFPYLVQLLRSPFYNEESMLQYTLAKIGEREWYFFVPRDRRPASGGRPNRTTERGFWKATGSDRPIRSAADPRRLIGLKKILVYYRGRGPRGRKTDWVMNEYRLPDVHNELSAAPPLPPMKRQEDVVLCKVYRKATSMRELEQRAAMEQDDGASAMAETASPSDQGNFSESFFALDDVVAEIKEERVDVAAPESTAPDILPEELPETPATRQLPSLPAIQVPSHGNFDWIHDAFVTQLRSPWLDQWSPLYAQLLNF
ncbi:NAC transcription factor NAM-B2 [Apostasia shenzhenica]|uniref:NAC transcription factor NAM-B2 n=1 Tax=Apostasia shenzhenica TaxID=1088818 RepID=A0A2I0AX40_9ASPA|nr:NAC transcription factor NAM-B2 [Apostasia shenzhenica]